MEEYKKEIKIVAPFKEFNNGDLLQCDGDNTWIWIGQTAGDFNQDYTSFIKQSLKDSIHNTKHIIGVLKGRSKRYIKLLNCLEKMEGNNGG